MRKLLFIVLMSFCALTVFFVYQTFQFSDRKLHVIFCNVGQGDGVIIKTPYQNTILFDSGPDTGILNCLSNAMSFWDKDIEYAFLSHPHADHFMGYLDILSSYTIKQFAGENLNNPSLEYQAFLKKLKIHNVQIQYLSRGNSIKTSDGVVFSVLGPTREYLNRTSPRGTIGESENFGSLHVRVTYKNFSMDLTGDNQREQLLDDLKYNPNPITVLQTPHHGSKTGLTNEILTILNPKFAVISVGAKNRYGHPSPFTLDLYHAYDIPYKRTDQNGMIEIVTDGEKIELRSER